MSRPPAEIDSDADLSDDGGSFERLQKVLAAAGIGSRRHCEEYIRDGRVSVDGKTVTELGIKVDPNAQKVCVDGERLKYQKKQYFLVNKPIGVVCTNADPQGRPRVVDLLPPWFGRLFSVGRLDETSEGLLLVTNDGELAHALAHPKFQVERVYRCIIAGIPTDETFTALRQGLHFTEGKFRMRDVRRVKSNGKSTLVEVILTEGQNREVRRLFARVGHKVLKLRRTAFGPLKLGELDPAAYRPLSPSEVRVLKNYAPAIHRGVLPGVCDQLPTRIDGAPKGLEKLAPVPIRAALLLSAPLLAGRSLDDDDEFTQLFGPARACPDGDSRDRDDRRT